MLADGTWNKLKKSMHVCQRWFPFISTDQVSDRFGFNSLFDDIKTGGDIMIDSWDLLASFLYSGSTARRRPSFFYIL